MYLFYLAEVGEKNLNNWENARVVRKLTQLIVAQYVQCSSTIMYIVKYVLTTLNTGLDRWGIQYVVDDFF